MHRTSVWSRSFLQPGLPFRQEIPSLSAWTLSHRLRMTNEECSSYTARLVFLAPYQSFPLTRTLCKLRSTSATKPLRGVHSGVVKTHFPDPQHQVTWLPGVLVPFGRQTHRYDASQVARAKIRVSAGLEWSGKGWRIRRLNTVFAVHVQLKYLTCTFSSYFDRLKWVPTARPLHARSSTAAAPKMSCFIHSRSLPLAAFSHSQIRLSICLKSSRP